MRRQDKYPDTAIFKYENLNPHKRITGDCVVRAIAKAIEPEIKKLHLSRGKVDPWKYVLIKMADYSAQTGYMISDTKCYKRFLPNNGFVKHDQPRHADGTKLTLREFIETHPKGTYLVNMANHLTVVIDGVNYDIWDCTKTDRRVGMYWEKNV